MVLPVVLVGLTILGALPIGLVALVLLLRRRAEHKQEGRPWPRGARVAAAFAALVSVAGLWPYLALANFAFGPWPVLEGPDTYLARRGFERELSSSGGGPGARSVHDLYFRESELIDERIWMRFSVQHRDALTAILNVNPHFMARPGGCRPAWDDPTDEPPPWWPDRQPPDMDCFSPFEGPGVNGQFLWFDPLTRTAYYRAWDN